MPWFVHYPVSDLDTPEKRERLAEEVRLGGAVMCANDTLFYLQPRTNPDWWEFKLTDPSEETDDV